MLTAGKSLVLSAPDCSPLMHATDPAIAQLVRSRCEVTRLTAAWSNLGWKCGRWLLSFCQASELQDKLFSHEAVSRHLSHRVSACSSNKHLCFWRKNCQRLGNSFTSSALVYTPKDATAWALSLSPNRNQTLLTWVACDVNSSKHKETVGLFQPRSKWKNKLNGSRLD